MEVDGRPLHVDLDVREAAQRRQNRRQPRREHRRIADDHRVAREALRLTLDEACEVRTADLLLAFGEHDDVHRQRAARAEVRLERLDVQVQLSLVVDGAARVDAAVPHGRLERRRLPQLERLGGLHIVVTVDEHRRCAIAGLAPLADDDRMAIGRDDLGRETDVAHARGKPLGGTHHVGPMLGARAHARDAQELEQLVVDARRYCR